MILCCHNLYTKQLNGRNSSPDDLFLLSAIYMISTAADFDP